MSYLTQDEIGTNQSMTSRVAQAAAQEGKGDNADGWTFTNRRYWAAAPGWSEAWESARASHPDDDEYDPGADEAVITDQMILSQVQAMDD
jgi:hypothetical protein